MEEITFQVPSLDPPFAICIVLCSCDFNAVGSWLHGAGKQLIVPRARSTVTV